MSQFGSLEQVSLTEPRELRLEDMVERMNRTQVVLLSVKEQPRGPWNTASQRQSPGWGVVGAGMERRPLGAAVRPSRVPTGVE